MPQARTECGHAISEVDNFCPTCGKKALPATKTVTERMLLPLWQDRIRPRYGEIEHMFSILHETEFMDTSVHVVEIDNGAYYLGIEIASFSVRETVPQELEAGIELGALTKLSQTVENYVKTLGWTRQPRLYIGIYVN